jgi:hypothetical protein
MNCEHVNKLIAIVAELEKLGCLRLTLLTLSEYQYDLDEPKTWDIRIAKLINPRKVKSYDVNEEGEAQLVEAMRYDKIYPISYSYELCDKEEQSALVELLRKRISELQKEEEINHTKPKKEVIKK